MDFKKPYITDKFTIYPWDIKYTKLSLAVWLVDDYTEKQPIGAIKVRIIEGNVKSFKNISGYYLFTASLKSPKYHVVVESDFYFTEKREIDTSLLDPKYPVTEIRLLPKPVYPFPSGTTLVRAEVRENPREEVIKAARVTAAVRIQKIFALAKLKQNVKKGENSILLGQIRGRIKTGDILLIRDNDISRFELCEVGGPLPNIPDAEAYTSADSLRFAHPSGTSIHNMMPEQFRENEQIAEIRKKTNENDEVIHLKDISDRINTDDILMIKNNVASRVEFCQIAGPLSEPPNNQKYKLRNQLQFVHPSETPLFLIRSKILDTKTTEDGEFVVYFRSVKVNNFTCSLNISHSDYLMHEQKIELREGDVTSPGNINLVSI